MTPISNMAQGTRFTANMCRFVKVSEYKGTVLGEEADRWRHLFTTPTGETLVYTGAHLITHTVGSYWDITATVKRQEPQFRCTRICRPIVTPYSDAQKALDI